MSQEWNELFGGPLDGLTIRRELHEHGSNGGLFGLDRRGRPISARRLREMAGDRGHEDLYAKAAPSAPVGWRRHVHRAIEEADEEGHPAAAALRTVLDLHHEDDDEEGERERDGEARESRQLKAWAGSLLEGTSPGHAAALRRWARNLRG
jgi:hypothetical protein